MELKKKRGIQLAGKLALIVSIPLVLIVLTGCLTGLKGMNRVSDILIREQLNTMAYAIAERLDAVGDGDFSYSDGTLYKGEQPVDQSILDDFKANTGEDISIILGNTRCLTTMTDASGASMKDQTISDSVYQKLQKGEAVYDDKLTIGKDAYYVYYEPLKDSAGAVCGSIFVGYNKDTISKMERSSITKLIVSLVVIAVVTLILVLVIMWSVGNIMHNTIGHLEEVADGSLNVSIQEKVMQRQDELGEMARSMQKLAQSLSSIVHNIITISGELDSFSDEFQESFRNIKEAIGNINTAVGEIARGATQQAGDTQQANEKVINMGNAIDVTSGNVEALTESARKMGEYNRSADQNLKELLDISRRANESVQSVQKQTDDTNRSAQEIQEVTELIASIASQTNLLSLNASIEAARAGEQGKGFAVVATEIRTLADQCRESADRINTIVNELIHNSDQSVQAMSEVMGIIGQQNDRLINTRDMFGELNQEIGAVSHAIGDISAQVEDLGETKNSVLELLEGLSAVAEENAASTQETSASMQELGDIVDECTENTAGLMKLSGELKENTTKFNVESIVEKFENRGQ